MIEEDLRFSDEVHRLYGVMNLGLHKKEWLAAGEYTIADMICYPWASGYKLRKIDLVQEGFDPGAIKDPLYVRDPKTGRYTKLDAKMYDDIKAGRLTL